MKTQLRVEYNADTLLALLGLPTLATIALAAPAPLKSESWPVPPGLPSYAVLRVIDGDTIEIEKLGTVRYIDVDTPETKHPQKPVEHLDGEAYEANRRLVEGKRVKLEFQRGTAGAEMITTVIRHKEEKWNGPTKPSRPNQED